VTPRTAPPQAPREVRPAAAGEVDGATGEALGDFADLHRLFDGEGAGGDLCALHEKALLFLGVDAFDADFLWIKCHDGLV